MKVSATPGPGSKAVSWWVRNNNAYGINNIIGGQGNNNIQTTGSAIDNLMMGLNNTITDSSYSFIGGQGCSISTTANYGLNAVLAMKPSIYNYKGNSASQKDLGFIAQDMQRIVPEVVDVPKNSSEMMDIRYSELIPVLAKAIQELKQEKDGQIRTLETEQTRLENENAALMTEVAELKAANDKLSGMAADMEALRKAVATIRAKEENGIRTVMLSQRAPAKP